MFTALCDSHSTQLTKLLQGQDELGRGTVLCVNYQLPATGPPLT